MVVTPTLKAAQVAAAETGADGRSAAWLVHQHGWRWDDDGHWTRHRPDASTSIPAARLRPGDLLLVDEAGMLDQDTARALLTIADETGARVALVGDRHQLPAVGRGGVLDHAARWAAPDRRASRWTTVHRFADPAYADAEPADAHRRRPRRGLRRPARARADRHPPHRGRTHRSALADSRGGRRRRW